MDVGLTAVLMFFVLPIFIAIAIAVKIDSRGPVFYRHERVGRGRRRIDVIKFRTMRLEACRGQRYGGAAAEGEFSRLMSDPALASEFGATFKFERDPRVTSIGRFLRRSSLDELPQLLNVLRGDLSLVGPRPVTDAELETYYGDAVSELLTIRPGLSGYWQINGRSRLSYEDRVRLDLGYLRAWSIRLDLEILGKTARALVARRGAQ